jgi:hypothetical protein
MHAKTALACATLLLGALAAGPVLAANSTSGAGALSGGNGSMTCGEFLQLGHQQQASLVGTIKMNSTPSSLTSNSGLSGSNSNNTMPGSSSNGTTAGNEQGSVVPTTPLTSGQLVAACQAAAPSTSLQDAYSSFGTSDSGQK